MFHRPQPQDRRPTNHAGTGPEDAGIVQSLRMWARAIPDATSVGWWEAHKWRRRQRAPNSLPHIHPAPSHVPAPPLRVLMVNNLWGLTGGAEQYISTIGEELTRRGYEVSVVCGQQSAWPDGAWRPHAEYVAPGLAPADPLTTEPGVAEDFQAVVNAVQPDIIHIHNMLEPAVLEAAVASAPTLRSIYDHNSYCPGYNKTFMDGAICTRTVGMPCVQRAVSGSGCMCIGSHYAHLLVALARKAREHRAMQQCRAIIAASHYLRRELLKVGHAPERVHVAPLVPRLHPGPSLPRTARPGTILWAGRMVLPDKGLDLLLEAVTRMRTDFRLILAGDGASRPFVDKKIRELDLTDKVQCTGWRVGEHLEQLYHEADVVVVPSMWAEPWGLLGLEAFSYGLPVVAFNVGAVPEWLRDRQTGYIVPRGDMSMLALRLDMLLNDASLRARMGRAGRDDVRTRFSLDAHMDTLTAVYSKAARPH